VVNYKLVVDVFLWHLWDRRYLIPHHLELSDLAVGLHTKKLGKGCLRFLGKQGCKLE
jgi:hypothetical protein